MKHACGIILALLVYLGVIYLVGSPSKEEAVTARDSTAEDASAASPSQPLPMSDADQLQAQQTQERVQHLETQTRELEMTEAAAQRMPAARRMAQAATVSAWTQVVSTNTDKYLELLQKAKQSARGQIECSICDGLSYMPCVMCKNHSGKCIHCDGTGHLAARTYCPTCLGKGKCYLCNGSGKMF